MPTPTYNPLITYTLPSDVGTIKFYNLSAAYRDLVVVVAGSSATATGLALTFNDVSTTTYGHARVNIVGTGAPGTNNNTSQSSIAGPNYGALPSSAVFHVMDYSATDKHKTVVYEGTKQDTNYFGVGRWASTAAIHTVQLTGTFTTGMTFSIYGIAA